MKCYIEKINNYYQVSIEHNNRNITFKEFFENILLNNDSIIPLMIRNVVMYISKHYYNNNMKNFEDEMLFNIVETKDLSSTVCDYSTFNDYFNNNDAIVKFMNISNDTLLICPNKSNNIFNTVLNFFELCNDYALYEMYNVIAEEIISIKSKNKGNLYLSTHGLGIPWLHFRLSNKKKIFPYLNFFGKI